MRSILYIFILFFAPTVAANICLNWSPAEKVSDISPEVINESSGLAVSSLDAQTLYHVNDSGDGPFLYKTNLKKPGLSKISITNFDPFDVESLAYGNCGSSKCVFIGDIGDNYEIRPDIQIIILEESDLNKSSVNPKNILNLKYPDGSHNAEGMAVHPDGSLYILTKKEDYENRKAIVPKLYKLSAQQVQNKSNKIKTLELVGSIDVPYLNFRYNYFGRIVSGLDISADGNKLLILTYRNFIEVNINLAATDVREQLNARLWKKKSDYKVTPTVNLPQQEAISYLPDGSILYTTEYHKGKPSGVYKTSCLK